MIRVTTIGNLTYQATVGPHEGTDVPPNVVRVEGPHLRGPAEYTCAPPGSPERLKEGAEGIAERAIRYTVDNIVLPMLAARTLQ